MKITEVVRLSVDIVQAYYRNDLSLFFEYLDEAVLWYGPAEGQFLSGRQAILETWAKEVHTLSFTMGNTRVDHVVTGPSSCEVMLSFPITTHYISGESILMDQVIHITWRERKIEGSSEKQPRMLVIHISDLYQKHESDTIYPVHFNQIYKGFLPITEIGRQIYFPGVDRADYYVLSNRFKGLKALPPAGTPFCTWEMNQLKWLLPYMQLKKSILVCFSDVIAVILSIPCTSLG